MAQKLGEVGFKCLEAQRRGLGIAPAHPSPIVGAHPCAFGESRKHGVVAVGVAETRSFEDHCGLSSSFAAQVQSPAAHIDEHARWREPLRVEPGGPELADGPRDRHCRQCDEHDAQKTEHADHSATGAARASTRGGKGSDTDRAVLRPRARRQLPWGLVAAHEERVHERGAEAPGKPCGIVKNVERRDE